jgi:hypothetical protein
VIPSEVTSALSGIAQAFGTGAGATADGGSRQATEPDRPELAVPGLAVPGLDGPELDGPELNGSGRTGTAG